MEADRAHEPVVDIHSEGVGVGEFVELVADDLLVVGGDDLQAADDRSGRVDSPVAPQADEHVDLDDLVDAPNDVRTGVDRVTDAFPGARVVDQ